MSLTPPVDGRLGVAKTYKLYVGGAFPRSESGRSYPVTDTKGRLLAHAALASRKDVRDAVSAARAALPGWSGATAYNRGQVLYRVAEMLQARRDGFVDDVVAAEGIGRQAGGRGRRRRRRPVGLVRGLDRQDRHGAGLGEPGRGAVRQLLHAGADGRDRGARARGLVAGRAGRRAGAGARRRMHRRRGGVDGAAAARGRAGRGARDVGRARRCGQPAHRPRRRAGARGWPRTPTSTGWISPGRPRTSPSTWSGAAADTVKRVLPRRGRPATWPGCAPWTELTTVWHPVGR